MIIAYRATSPHYDGGVRIQLFGTFLLGLSQLAPVVTVPADSDPHQVQLFEFAQRKPIVDAQIYDTYYIFPARLWSARLAILSMGLTIVWCWSRHRATSWIGVVICAGFLTWAFVDISRYTFSGSPCVMRHYAWALAGVGLLHLSPAWWPRKM